MDPAPVLGFDPDDPEAWIVLADWLTERGDPRGLMLALEASGRDAGQLEQLRREHLHRYSEALWPVFGVRSEAELMQRIELRWRAGLVVGARPLDESFTSAQLEGLLASEAAVALAELRCELVDPQVITQALTAGPPRATLRKLTLGDYRTPVPALDKLWPKLPELRDLELLGPGIELRELATGLPKLVRLRLCCELDPTPLRAFEGSAFSGLRALELRLGGHDYFAQLEPLAPLLDGRATPVLERLAITGVAFGDELIAVLARSPLLDRLRWLDLSDSRFGPHAHSPELLDRPGLALRLRGSDHSAAQREALQRHFGDRFG
ncbi:MAG TPA: hypothetical protein VM869_16605 [Enhygromyxa sp.]|nr:hypothetical protein [Enhygromyxa sp.]